MGMDLYGESGNYFRASCWSWRPIHNLVDELNENEKLGLSTDGWSYNDGCGLDNQLDCNRLADAIENYLRVSKVKTVALEIAGRLRVDTNGVFVKEGGFTPYHTDAEHLMEFVAFLRKCNGFKIW